jgi:hypothetical protein
LDFRQLFKLRLVVAALGEIQRACEKALAIQQTPGGATTCHWLDELRIEPTVRYVSVALDNTTTFSEDDRTFVERLAAEDLTPQDFRALSCP